jgi:predicted Fe-Mo cluster-binding NifX family protein
VTELVRKPSLVCVPVDNDEDWDAPVSAHFSSAPWFALVAGTQLELVDARDLDEGCEARVELLRKREVTIVLTQAASASVLGAFEAADLLALQTSAPNLRQAILSLMMGAVAPLSQGSCCGKHEHEDGACAHNP